MSNVFYQRFLILLFLSIALFLGGNNLVHLTDPDEVFYTLTAREMADRNEWLTPYIFNQPQFEKPILTYDLIRVSFDAFGQTPFAARFFPAVFACFGVLGIYALGLFGFGNERRAFLAALVMATSAFYMAMAKTVFTDMIFSVLILYSLLSFYLAYLNPDFRRAGIFSFYIFAALAVLAKGPLGLLIPLAAVIIFLLYQREISFLKTPWFLIGFGLCLVISIPWYWYEISKYGDVFIKEFFVNDHWRRLTEAEHRSNDTWYFYPITMLAGLFPWTLFVAAAFVDLFKRLKFTIKPFEYFLLSWILVVFIIFQVSHSKLASYILPMFPALALLAANYIDERLEQYQHRVLKIFAYCMIGFLTVLGIGVLAAHKAYDVYIPTLVPAYWLSAVLISLGGISLVLLFREKIREALILLGFSLVSIFITAFMIVGFIEPHISMNEACLYVPSLAMKKTTILTSKPYARGVAFYTHQEVAVLNIAGENYFSPHPIPIITTEEALEIFLAAQQETYAIVRKSQYEDIKKHVSDKFQVNLLKISGRNYILKIDPIKP